MLRPIDEVPLDVNLLVTGVTPFEEDFFMYAKKSSKTGNWIQEDGEILDLVPTKWEDTENPALEGTGFQGPKDSCALIDCGCDEPYPSGFGDCGGGDGGGGGGDGGGGGGDGGGGSGMWSGHECGWRWDNRTKCQVGCDTGRVGGVIPVDGICPYGKCDANRCPCFLVGAISPYCQ